MESKYITQKEEWESFLLETKWTPFFQSWEYGESQKNSTTDVIRIGIYDKNKLLMSSQIYIIHARRGLFLHIRHGPNFIDFSKPAFETLLKEWHKIATEHTAQFIRMSPLIETSSNQIIDFKKYGFINSPLHNQDAENCIVLDLDKPEEDLFKNFREATRKNARKAERSGVDISEDFSPKNIKNFFELYDITAARQHFMPHKHIEQELDILKNNGMIKLYVAYYEGKAIAASLIVFYGNQAVYHHSGSIHSPIPVNYLIQWKAIQEAKKRGMKYYNFWGIAPENKPKHPWQGLTFFKKGFGGREVDFLHSMDLPLKKSYWLNYLYSKYWSFRKGYL